MNGPFLKHMPDNETATPAWEIERKFLVAEAPPGLERYPHEAIRQGYLALSEDGTEVRLRHKADRFFQTIKQGEGLQRTEVEIPLARPQFEALWPLTEGKRVEKVRYAIAHEGRTIELDVYQGALAGLITAEVEFPSLEASAAFQPPLWLGVEITEDARYKNKNLAVFGMPPEGV